VVNTKTYNAVFKSNHTASAQLLTARRIAVFFLMSVLFCIAPRVAAFQLALEWDENPEANITGYNLHYGLSSGVYTTHVSVENQTSYTLSNLADGKTHYLAVTAYNAYGESGYSNELVHTPTQTANRAPVATGISISVTEDTAKTGSLSATDPDGNRLTFSIATRPSLGSVALTASTGAFTYTPNANANGSDSFTFRASDGSLTSNAATVSVTISAVNDPPIANADSTTTTTNQSVTLSVLTNDTDADGNTLSLASAIRGAHGSTSLSGTAVKYTPDQGFTGTDTFSYTVTDGRGGSDTATVTVNVSSAGVPSQSVVTALNIGGAGYTGAGGTVYQADAYHSGGSVRSVSSSIAGTVDDTLYQSYRYGDFSYAVPVANGTYLLTLKFSEAYYTSADQRVFDVLAEGKPIAGDLDVFSRAGRYSAYDITVPVTIKDGSLSLTFGAQAGSPILSGMVLRNFTRGTAFGINAGGGSYTAVDGQLYSQDYGATTDKIWEEYTTNTISGTQDDTLYSSEHYGTFSYNLAVPNGTYLVTSKFAETYYTYSGGRIFDILMEGEEVVNNLDLFAVAGKNVAYDFSELVNVTDGVLNITFSPVKGYPKVCGILIEAIE
jgi:hypothetical protein